MINRKKGIRKCPYIISLMLIFLIVISPSLFGGKAYGEDEGLVEKKGFYLSVEDGLISISANDALLKEILEEIGERMKVEVIVNIPKENKISVKFHRLALTDALEKLSSNYGYIINTENGEKRVSRIFFLPKGKDIDNRKFLNLEIKETVKEKKLQAEHFKFQFDPSEFVQK